MLKNIVFYTNSHGLCNRLRAMVGFQAMARILEMPFYLCWTPDRSCPAHFSELFQEYGDLQIIDEKELPALQTDNTVEVFTRLDWFSVIWERYLQEKATKQDFLRTVFVCLEELKPLPAIQERLEFFLKGKQIENTYALHIRMTDNLVSYQNWQGKVPDFNIEHVSRLEGFEKYISDRLAKDPAARFFLATDNPQVEKTLKEKYPGKIFALEKEYSAAKKKLFAWRRLKFIERYQRTTPIQDALTDLLVLVRCKEIVGTYFSSFSKFAAVWGQVPYYEVQGTEYIVNQFIDEINKLKP